MANLKSYVWHRLDFLYLIRWIPMGARTKDPVVLSDGAAALSPACVSLLRI